MSAVKQRPKKDESTKILQAVLAELPAFIEKNEDRRFTGVTSFKVMIGDNGFMLEWWAEGEQILMPLPDSITARVRAAMVPEPTPAPTKDDENPDA